MPETNLWGQQSYWNYDHDAKHQSETFSSSRAQSWFKVKYSSVHFTNWDMKKTPLWIRDKGVCTPSNSIEKANICKMGEL